MKKLKENILNTKEIQSLKGRCNDCFKTIINSQAEFESKVSSWNTDFTETVFNCDIQLIDKTLNNQFDFSHSYFVGSFLLENVVFDSKVDFINTKFGDNINFTKTTFSKEVEFSESDIMQDCYFSELNFKEYGVFINTRFYKCAKITGCRFSGGSDFTGSIFYDVVDFSRCTFFEEAYFLSTRFQNKAIFDYSTFIKDVDFKEWLSNSPKDGIISMERVNFKNNVFFQGRLFKQINLTQSSIGGKMYIYENSFVKANRDTFCIIKNEFIKQNNKIEALKFNSKEMSEYWSEIIYKPYKIDWWILFFNTISNKNGLNPLRGIVFTLSFGLFLYSLLMIGTSLNISDESYWIGYLNFLIPTHSLNDLFCQGYDIGFGQHIIDIMGRIFIGYGIYQTIQAFRKYGKI